MTDTATSRAASCSPTCRTNSRHADVDADADQLSGNPDRLEQVIENLLGNALRYVPDGGRIALHASIDGDAAILSVTDDGAGDGASLELATVIGSVSGGYTATLTVAI